MYFHAKHKRIIAIVICALFLAALVLSLVYITKEAHHDCIGHNCPICAQIQMAQRTVDQLGSALSLFFSVGFALLILCLSAFHCLSAAVLCTPVTLSVRMNN